ncbi:MAG: hypothetical protein AAF266_16260, partial [Planctomycetota bacterium]
GTYQRRLLGSPGVDRPLFEEVFAEKADGVAGGGTAVDELLWALADHAGNRKEWTARGSHKASSVRRRLQSPNLAGGVSLSA